MFRGDIDVFLNRAKRIVLDRRRRFLSRDRGQRDIILDPGFGFGKTMEQNFDTLYRMELLQEFGLPVLAGLSRKTMIWRTLGITPAEALNGTSVLNTVALMKGASILRVHDVKEAVEAVKLVTPNF